MVIAYPAGKARLADIEKRDLFHITDRALRSSIVVGEPGGSQSDRTPCQVHLKAGQGWSVAPFRLLRDYSVLDPHLTGFKDYGCYTYFFVGQPGWWALKKNIGLDVRWGDLGPDKMVLRIAGADLLKCGDALFYRPDDRVLILRGEYRGPAHVEELA